MYRQISTILSFVIACSLLLLAVPAGALSKGGGEGLQSIYAVSALQDLEITTYKDIPYTGQLPMLAEAENPSFVIVEQPKKGTVTLDGDTFLYTPKAGKTGKDSFTYAATDLDGQIGQTAKVFVTIEKRRSQVTYRDMEGRSGYAAAISLAERDIYEGRQLCGDYFFDPDVLINRTEFLAMAMEMVGLEIDTTVTLTAFSDDATIPAWAKGHASAAVREGVIRGVATEEGLAFCGEKPITLQEAAAILDRLLNVADVYLEDHQTAWAAQAVANMESVQVVAAGSFGSDCVTQPVTMVEAAEMLAAAGKVLEDRDNEGHLFDWF